MSTMKMHDMYMPAVDWPVSALQDKIDRSGEG